MIETSTPWIGMQLRSTALASLSATGPLERPRPSAHRHPSSHRVSAPAALIIIPPPPPACTHAPTLPHPPSPTPPVEVWTDRSPLPSIRTPSPDRRPVPTNDEVDDRRHRHHQQHRRRRHHENSVRLQPTDAPPPPPFSSSSSTTADRSCCDPSCSTIDTDGYMNEVARTADDRRRLAQARLRVAAGGYYHGSMSSADARRRLADRPVGTFLVRDSSDRGRYPFAITVLIAGRPAGAGPASTSIRIVYESGRFRFDGVPETVDRLPSFECVVALIRHHVGLTTSTRSGSTGSRRPPPTTETGTGSGGGGGSDGGVVAFVGRSAALSDESSSSTSPAGLLPVVLSRPLPVSDAPSALKHLCRRRISAALDGRSVGRLQLLPSLKDYLLEYPYDL